jgi:hypothetical protein
MQGWRGRGLETRDSSESIQQLQKVSTISILYCSESQSHPHLPPRADYALDPICPCEQKVNLRYGNRWARLSSFEKHTTTADIQNRGGFGAPIAMPITQMPSASKRGLSRRVDKTIGSDIKCLHLSRVFTEGVKIDQTRYRPQLVILTGEANPLTCVVSPNDPVNLRRGHPFKPNAIVTPLSQV